MAREAQNRPDPRPLLIVTVESSHGRAARTTAHRIARALGGNVINSDGLVEDPIPHLADVQGLRLEIYHATTVSGASGLDTGITHTLHKP